MATTKTRTKAKKVKVASKETAEFVIEGLNKIREMDATNGIKAQRERRLGKSCLVKLSGRSNRNNENKPCLAYYNREVSKLRTLIRQYGFIRHDFSDKIGELAAKYPLAKNELNGLIDIDPHAVKGSVTDALTKLESRHARTKNPERKTELKKAIAALKKTKCEPVIFETLIRTKKERAKLLKAAEERVEAYHAKPRPIDYHTTYERMGRLLTATHDWAALTFGLVLACGRRSSEVVCHLDGTFKPTARRMEVEFTTVVKTKEAKTYKIPLLVDRDIFFGALDRLRSHPRIAELMERTDGIKSYDQRHHEINSSIQSQLNDSVKDEMEGNREWRKIGADGKPKGSPWKLKDGRAMYARIAYAEYCATAKKAGRVPAADDLFFKNTLGHTDQATQQNYKQFTLQGIDSLNYSEVKQVKTETAKAKPADRLAALTELFDTEEVQGRRAFVKYGAWVIGQVKAEPGVKITSTWIRAELGGNKGIIAQFVKIVREAGLQDAF